LRLTENFAPNGWTGFSDNEMLTDGHFVRLVTKVY